MSLHCRRFFLFCFLLLLLFHSLNSYDPPNPLWGSSTADGPSISVPLFMLITRETQAALVGRPTPAVSLLKRFIAEDGMRDRLKGMANLMNPEDLELGATLHNILVHYNMKPVLSSNYSIHKPRFGLFARLHVLIIGCAFGCLFESMCVGCVVFSPCTFRIPLHSLCFVRPSLILLCIPVVQGRSTGSTLTGGLTLRLSLMSTSLAICQGELLDPSSNTLSSTRFIFSLQ
eukprot:m.332947 g.332947  ORF g.332947 m.332947 type:complete len:230 (+) comp55643_c0_seq13:339-1028(+)